MLKMVRLKTLAKKQAQIIPCTVVIYGKGGTIQRSGCLVTGSQIKMASKSRSFRPMASPMRGNSRALHYS